MNPPLISILTPVHNPPEYALIAMLASVSAQTLPSWQHCIVDDGSSKPYVRRILDAAAARDPRVIVSYHDTAAGIAAASNTAFAQADGEFVALLDHDDALHPEALRRVADALAADEAIDYLYTDEDKIDEYGQHFDLFLKPDWSPERFQVQMYTCHLSVLRRSLVDEVGRFRKDFDGSQDWDLVLRVTEAARRVHHVREVCYHWRAVENSAAADINAKPYAADAARRAINEHFERTSFQGRITNNASGGVHTIVPALTTDPLISIVIPTAGGAKRLSGAITTLVTNAVQSIVERSSYENYELVVVADASVTPDVLSDLLSIAGNRLHVVPYDSAFNFSDKVNLGVGASNGEMILLLNDDVEVLPDTWRDTYPSLAGSSLWLERLVMHATAPGVGIVGAKLFFNDLRLQHVGVIAHGGLPSHQYRGFRGDFNGYFSNANAVCNYSAVTAACAMVPRVVFEEVGGFDIDLPVNYNDVDFCFKVRNAGYRCVYNPDVQLLHYESASRESRVHPHEIEMIQNRWRTVLNDDPYFHPYFFQKNPDFQPPPMLSDGRLVVPMSYKA